MAEFDREYVAETFSKPPPVARAAWQAAKRRPGHPKSGAGVKVVSVSLERGLLKQTDRLEKPRIEKADKDAAGRNCSWFIVEQYPDMLSTVREVTRGYLAGLLEATGAQKIEVTRHDENPSGWRFQFCWI